MSGARPMLQRLLRLGLLAAGLFLFGWLLHRGDMLSVMDQVAKLGLAGFGVILVLFAIEFYLDVIAWQLLLGVGPLRDLRFGLRLYRIRMAGEAVNVLTPLGGMGGEPVKALLLKRDHGIALAHSGASLVLAKTLNVLALVLFAAVGFGLMSRDPRIGSSLYMSAGAGLGLLSFGIVAFVAIQWLGFAERLGRAGVRFSTRIPDMLHALAGFDAHLRHAYSRQPGRFVAALLLGFGNWVVGAVSIQICAAMMGQRLSFAEAWIIESLTQLVRALTFLIPASIGAQEGILVLVLGALGGRADLGLALALVRRGRELVWVALGGAQCIAALGRDSLAGKGAAPEK